MIFVISQNLMYSFNKVPSTIKTRLGVVFSYNNSVRHGIYICNKSVSNSLYCAIN